MADPRLVLLSRTGCHLCDDARAVLASVADELGVAWDERDVDADGVLADEYGDRVPVVLLDGAEHSYWRVDEGRLRAALAGRRRW
ncbi:MAG TPA: glutaredoxin family protein [Frankiaceae bacterium]|nr:glutaredoxin family protein [Frankiaceae bacterium]